MSSEDLTPGPEELVQLVAANAMFKHVDPTHLEGLHQFLRWRTLPANQELFHEGDTVDGFYFVVTGRLKVTKLQVDRDGNPDNDLLVLAEMQPGDTIGEMQILTGGTRTATVTASEPCTLIHISKTGFDQLLAKDAQVVTALTATIMPRLYRDQLVSVLPNLFGELDEAMLGELQDKMTWIHLERGQLLYREGEASDSFCVIISGRLRTTITDAHGQTQIMGEMAQGESVGEMGVVTGAPRSATVVASRDSELIEFSREEFEELSERYPQLLRHVTRLLVRRLQSAFRQTARSNLSTNILVAPASRGAPVDRFACELEAVLSESGSCLRLTSASVDAWLGHEGISQADVGEPDDLRLRSWLSSLEQSHRFLIFQTDPAATDWTRRCIRQVDEMLYVGEANGTGELTEVEHEVEHQRSKTSMRARHSLVLSHPVETLRPQKTFRWLKLRQLDRHFHVRTECKEDFQRIARFVGHNEVGLVLSGGGARGFAHVGIIRAIRALGIPIDLIAGVSMGSLVAASYAYDPDQFVDGIKLLKAQLRGVMNDFTPPLVSVSRGGRFDRRVKRLYGDVNIEDLWMPYFCVSSNLTQADISVHQSGPIWRSVRASGSLPGLVTPVIQDGDLLFDGCLLDNLPMDVMRQWVGNGAVIAVDVVPPVDLEVKVENLESPSGWWLLMRKLNPLLKPIPLPNIVKILQRAGELGSVYGRQRLIDTNIADLYLRPPVEEFEILDFSTVDESAQIGYEFGLQKLRDWNDSRMDDRQSTEVA
ncbi:MAG: cyclic nucleotide-binding and patatin-like phospholipase domain-containing protein [Pirellulaceae bacterium]|jgi:NTE family protein/lysophospholipid hydrolase|nr:cyclic nucleotide-binding and patatin-like phospholipase domain-containing protein [Pirellulaceae bacterium]